jgi:2-polyprenyl-3-methyl-5-hydroxy-6-metoxy-1,4-benzoquinol methylase
VSDARRDRIAASWRDNAAAWTRIVREGGIESRRVATDAAICTAIRAVSPRCVLDVGCGEGWLCRALAREGTDVVGIDAAPALIDAARAAGGARFELMSYAQADALRGLGAFDAIACNFALLDDDPAPLLHTLAAMLTADGALLIQTVHPWTACGDAPYRDGWREESFAGFDARFATSMPWYFRTLQSWSALFAATGLRVERLQEPTHPERGTPLSLLFTLRPGHARDAARLTASTTG